MKMEKRRVGSVRNSPVAPLIFCVFLVIFNANGTNSENLHNFRA